MDRLEEKDLEVGDHIFVWHCMSHIHHGIYIGDNKVVHFSTPVEHGGKHGSAVERIELETFNVDGDIFLYLYGVSDDEIDEYPHGTCTSRASDDVSVVLKRAKEVLQNGFGNYDMIGNNCEDLAMYCKTGKKAQTSGQTFAAMRRIALAKQAADQGYRSPLAYAGCVIGLFNESDLNRAQMQELKKQNGGHFSKKNVKFEGGESNEREGTKKAEEKKEDAEAVSKEDTNKDKPLENGEESKANGDKHGEVPKEEEVKKGSNSDLPDGDGKQKRETNLKDNTERFETQRKTVEVAEKG